MVNTILPDFADGDNPPRAPQDLDLITLFAESEVSDLPVPSPATLRPIICSQCGLMVAEFPDTDVNPNEFGPAAPLSIKAIGCLCSLLASGRLNWLISLVEDAEAGGEKREYGWQGRLLAALVFAGMPGDRAYRLTRQVVPLHPRLLEWAKARLGRVGK